MDHKRIISLGILLVAAAIGGLLLLGSLVTSAERSRVRIRYQAMVTALGAGDTNSARLLFAPAYRARAVHDIERLPVFAHPLGPKSAISISGARADVCPERRYPLIPFGTFGHTIEMVRVDGEWYFTGKISVW